MKNPDGCMQRARRQKMASGVTVYLMEELGDARLNCAQLTHYIDLARQIVEKSPQRDHIFESAGHLLQAIPEHLFKLEKSLQAVALAADRLDYEEIKQDLKPEKVEELERVLKDVRIRNVPHRSEPRIPMNPMQAAEEIQKIATETRANGSVPMASLLTLIASLEGQDRTASDVTVTADFLEEMGKSLLKPVAGKSPSRVQLATTLRKIAADHLSCGPLMEEHGSAEEAARRSRFEKNVPADPTQNMAPEDKAEWEAKNKEHGDKFKEAWKVGADRSQEQFINIVDRLVGSVEESAKQLRHSIDLYKRDPRQYAPQLGNIARELVSLTGVIRRLQKGMPDNASSVYLASSDKIAKFSPQDVNQLEGLLQDILTEAAALQKMDGAKDKATEIREQAAKALKKLKSASDVQVIASDYTGKMYVTYTQDGKKKKVGPLDQRAAKTKLTELLSDPKIERVGFERAEEMKSASVTNKWKVYQASGRTKHLSGKSGRTLCGETAHADTIVDSVKDATCYYCKQAWEKAH